MSEQEDRLKDNHTEQTAKHRPVWVSKTVVALLLAGLGLMGVALEDLELQGIRWYWIVLIPVFCLVGIWDTWKLRKPEQPLWPAIRHQVFHWAGLMVALQIMVLLIDMGTFDRNSAGLIALLLLALSSFSAGVAYNRSFLLVGVLLAGAVLGSSYVEEYMWIILTSLVAIIAILILLNRLVRHRAPDADETRILEG